METEPPQDRPFIETPDELDDDSERNGALCFINEDRQCGADCMAYSTFVGEGQSLNEEQKHCVLLVSADRLGRHSGIAAKAIKDVVSGQQDQVRAAAPPPRSPTGGG